MSANGDGRDGRASDQDDLRGRQCARAWQELSKEAVRARPLTGRTALRDYRRLFVDGWRDQGRFGRGRRLIFAVRRSGYGSQACTVPLRRSCRRWSLLRIQFTASTPNACGEDCREAAAQWARSCSGTTAESSISVVPLAEVLGGQVDAVIQAGVQGEVSRTGGRGNAQQPDGRAAVRSASGLVACGEDRVGCAARRQSYARGRGVLQPAEHCAVKRPDGTDRPAGSSEGRHCGPAVELAGRAAGVRESQVPPSSPVTAPPRRVNVIFSCEIAQIGGRAAIPGAGGETDDDRAWPAADRAVDMAARSSEVPLGAWARYQSVRPATSAAVPSDPARGSMRLLTAGCPVGGRAR